MPATPEILFLVTAAFGLLAVGRAPGRGRAPAPRPRRACRCSPSSPCPPALADALLPAWTVVARGGGLRAAAVTGDGARAAGAAAARGCRRRSRWSRSRSCWPSGSAPARAFIGTAGRFAGAGAGGERRDRPQPVHLAARPADATRPGRAVRVRGLARADLPAGADPERVRAGRRLAGHPAGARHAAARAGPAAAGHAGRQVADVQIENVGFHDYWLPLYGEPLSVDGAARPRSGPTTSAAAPATRWRPRQDDELAASGRCCPGPPPTSCARATAGTGRRARLPRRLTGVDPRVIELAQRGDGRPGHRRSTGRWRCRTTSPGPDSAFRYSLQTAPGTGDDALVEFLTVGPDRVLRAVRLGDGGDAARGRHPVPGGGRVHRRHRLRRLPLDPHLRRARLGGGLVPRHRLGDVRPDPADRRPDDHPGVRAGGPRPSSAPRRAPTRPATPGRAGCRAGPSRCRHRRRSTAAGSRPGRRRRRTPAALVGAPGRCSPSRVLAAAAPGARPRCGPGNGERRLAAVAAGGRGRGRRGLAGAAGRVDGPRGAQPTAATPCARRPGAWCASTASEPRRPAGPAERGRRRSRPAGTADGTPGRRSCWTRSRAVRGRDRGRQPALAARAAAAPLGARPRRRPLDHRRTRPDSDACATQPTAAHRSVLPVRRRSLSGLRRLFLLEPAAEALLHPAGEAVLVRLRVLAGRRGLAAGTDRGHRDAPRRRA